MFINFSNHPSAKWSEKQIAEAKKYGEIADIPFPDVSPYISEEEIDNIALKYTKEIISKKPDAVMCQGEYTLSFNVAMRLKKEGITVLCACSERCTIEIADNENNMRESLFTFVRFRKY